MRYQPSSQQASRRFVEITNRARQRLWDVMGIDGKAITSIAEEVNQELNELADGIRSDLSDSSFARSTAAQHDRSLRRLKKTVELEAQGVIPFGSIDDLVQPSPCHCGIAVFADSVGHSESVISQQFTANITWDPPEESCNGHPLVDAQGQGDEALSVSELDAICTHTFLPVSTGVYCIRPVVQLNGHYLAWTWGGCEQEPGRACVRVRLEVEVEQPAGEVLHSQSFVVVNECASIPGGDSSLQSGFAYDSAFQQGTGVNAILMGGEEVTVRVSCTSFAQVFNRGRAWVDMQTSAQFYFRVPYVRWGERTCP